MNRRTFIKTSGVSALAFSANVMALAGDAKPPAIGGLNWFREAGVGLWLQYGLYSLLAGRNPDRKQLIDKIPVKEYEKLKARFTANKFDADFITDLAREAGMKYFNFTAMHQDGFCLFDTKETDFTSMQSAAKRDLVAEISEQCHRKGLGLCLSYYHGRNWHHPDAPSREKYGDQARPDYQPPDPAYSAGADYDIGKYVAYCRAQIKELLTHYGPVANLWLEGDYTLQKGPWKEELFIPELYQMIRQLQPRCLITYKMGLTGTEDCYGLESHLPRKQPERFKAVQATGKPFEFYVDLEGWAYNEKDRPENSAQAVGDAESVLRQVAMAKSFKANLLLHFGPVADGSISPHSVETLRAVGKKLKLPTRSTAEQR